MFTRKLDNILTASVGTTGFDTEQFYAFVYLFFFC